MMTHLLEVTREAAETAIRQEVLREILVVIMLAGGPWSFVRLPSMETPPLN